MRRNFRMLVLQDVLFLVTIVLTPIHRRQVVSAANDDNQDCTLDCPLDAPCQFGLVDFNGHPMDDAGMNRIGEPNHLDGMYCSCPPNWAGVRCDHQFITCENTDHICYHGGTCVSHLINEFGQEKLICDCSTAVETDGTQYVGKYCEIEKHNACDNDKEDLFCVNGGECNPDFETTGIPCNCLDGYEGVHCEFESQHVPPCTLECQNGGKCAVGLTSKDEDILNVWYDLREHMKCLCPPGFTGPLCDISHSECGTSDYHFCLNGGTCVGEEETYFCDCTTASSSEKPDTLFAGRYCQYPSTSICTDPDDPTELTTSFCVNGGRCNKDLPHGGCICPEGFTGAKCEFQVQDTSSDNSNNNNNNDDDDDDDDSTAVCSSGLQCFNGGICVVRELIINGEIENEDACNCSQARQGNISYSGPSCQYRETMSCSDENPSLFCVNGGTCRDNPNDGCDCPIGWTGDKCEVHTPTDRSQGNAKVAVTCGDKNCFNGGTCAHRQVVTEGGEFHNETYCDCAMAFDEDFLYAGTSCQHISTTLCTEPIVEEGQESSLKGQLFCTNHGTCKDNVRLGCDCQDGFFGFSCQFEQLDAEEEGNGADDQSDNDDVVDIVEACGDLVCHHGGKCVTETAALPDGSSGERGVCDCTTAKTSTAFFAGDSCEFKSTTLCTDPQADEDVDGAFFCVNGGTCKFNILQGCDCPVGWTGSHCEFQMEVEELNDLEDTETSLAQCGDGYCLNGGTCTSKLVSTGSDSEEQLHCDCSTAGGDGEYYAGEWCEHQATVDCTNSWTGVGHASFCVNHGKCKSNIYEGCDCSSAWMGYHCEYAVDPVEALKDYVSEGDNDDEDDDDDDEDMVDRVDQFETCGDDFCYHGGTCITFRDNGEVKHACDCTKAVTDTDLYAGQFCQYKSTSLCTSPEPNATSLEGVLFCVNDGQCKADPSDGCDCPTGYSGSQCEYTLYENQGDEEDSIAPNFDNSDTDNNNQSLSPPFDDPEYIKCTLHCQNNGTCVKGVKDLSSLELYVHDVDYLNKTYDEENFEHCACPNGWIGLQCEHEVEVCGKGEHICLHGSACVSDEGKHACDCSSADAPTFSGVNGLFAGDSCQHEATDICSVGEMYPGRPLYFCVNGGRCNASATENDPNPGCTCPEDWTGAHCEIQIVNSQLPIIPLTGRMRGVAIFGIVLSVIGTLGVLFAIRVCCRAGHDDSRSCMFLRRRRTRRFRPRGFEDEEIVGTINLAPRRSEGYGMRQQTPTSEYKDEPMMSLTLPPDDEPEMEPDDLEDGPIFLGPPRDEDGHVLHQVELI